MHQQFHIKRESQIDRVTEWLSALPAEKKNGVPVHHIQSFQMVSLPIQSAAVEYVAIVLCQHTTHSPSRDQAVIEHLLTEHFVGEGV